MTLSTSRRERQPGHVLPSRTTDCKGSLQRPRVLDKGPTRRTPRRVRCADIPPKRTLLAVNRRRPRLPDSPTLHARQVATARTTVPHPTSRLRQTTDVLFGWLQHWSVFVSAEGGVPCVGGGVVATYGPWGH
jgi:hypothetical protein